MTDFRMRLGVMAIPPGPTLRDGGHRVQLEIPKERLQVLYSLLTPGHDLANPPRFQISLWNSPDGQTLKGKLHLSDPDNSASKGGKFNALSNEQTYLLDRSSPHVFVTDGVLTVKRVELDADELRDDGLYFSIRYSNTTRAAIRPRSSEPLPDKPGLGNLRQLMAEAEDISAEEAERLMQGDGNDDDDDDYEEVVPEVVSQPVPAPTPPVSTAMATIPTKPARNPLDFSGMSFEEAAREVAAHRNFITRMVEAVNQQFAGEGELTFTGEMTKVLIQKHISAI